MIEHNFPLQEEQRIGDKSYSDYKSNNFDCGRFKLISDINGDEPHETLPLSIHRDKRNVFEISDDFVFYFTLEDQEGYYCGATMINDRCQGGIFYLFLWLSEKCL